VCKHRSDRQPVRRYGNNQHAVTIAMHCITSDGFIQQPHSNKMTQFEEKSHIYDIRKNIHSVRSDKSTIYIYIYNKYIHTYTHIHTHIYILHVRLNPELPWQKQHLTRILFPSRLDSDLRKKPVKCYI
jgi:hypothetical protein